MTCPNCGYCPHCGRQALAPYPYVQPPFVQPVAPTPYPWGQVWTSPLSTAASAIGNTTTFTVNPNASQT